MTIKSWQPHAPAALQAPSGATTCCGSSFCQPAKGLGLILRARRAQTHSPIWSREYGGLSSPPAADQTPTPPSPRSITPHGPAQLLPRLLQTPKPLEWQRWPCRASHTSLAATYPRGLSAASLGSHPGTEGSLGHCSSPLPPQPPRSAQGSVGISPVLPANGITATQLS